MSLGFYCQLDTGYFNRDMPWCENECSHVPTQYVLVCKMYVHECYTIRFGMINDCLHVIHKMLWCENECLHVLYHMIWCDRRAVGNICTGVKTNPNHQKHNQKYALALTLLTQ